MLERMNRGMLLVVGIAIGGVLGAVGATVFSSPDDTTRPAGLQADAPEPEQAPPAPVLHTLGDAGDAEGAVPTAAPGPGDLHLTRAAFFEAYRERFLSRTGSEPTEAQRAAAWDALQQQTHAAALAAGEQAARATIESRRKAEITQRDDIMALLEDKEREDDVLALRNDPAALVRLLDHKAKGPSLDGARHLTDPGDDGLPDGSVLLFPRGIFTLTEKAVLGIGPRSRMPRDLTIEGAGMDRTLITLSDFSARDLVYNLHLKDCTIDCGNDGAFDLRREKASVFAENVRFVRFDAGHGGCHIFSLRGGAVYCHDCRFDGGYGKSPGSGSILRGVTVARLDGCVFDRISYEIGRHTEATFAGCTFRDCARMPATLKRALAKPSRRGARYEDGTIETSLEPDERSGRAKLKRDIKTLFPGFKEK
jgi:hypothetical protein